ncbi:MAG: methyltransferase domain-containing protein [Nitrospira sp.]|nr:methyltransferase domain-containing protein [Nitrospira sp.]
MLDLERRSAPRIDLQAEARLTLNGDAWEGTILNLSLGGLYMVLPASVPVTSNQPIQLGLVSEVGVLEITGTVLGLRETEGPSTNPSGMPALGIAIKYAPIGGIEERILESLLEGLREHTVAIKLTGLLIPQETGDLLLEVQSGGTEATNLTSIPPSVAEAEDQAPPERRLTSRGTLSIPVQVEQQHPSSQSLHLSAQTVDLSLGGMCLRLETQPDLLAGPLVLRLSLSHNPAAPPLQASSLHSSISPGAEKDFECTLTAEVVWKMVDPAEERTQDCPSRVFRIGLRIPYLSDAIRFRIAGLVAQLLTAPKQIEQDGTTRTLISEALDCRNILDQRIALYYDHSRDELPPGTPVVIISPGYGESKKEHIPLAYTFAVNGFRVLRFDYTNHVGESDGEIQHSTLNGMKQDLTAVLDFAERSWPAGPLTVVASSLAGRVALKAAAGDRRVRLLILLNAVMDVRATLVAVHQEDHMGLYLNGASRGVMNVLGFNIDADRWLKDAITEGYADLRSTVKDAAEIQAPVIMFAAEHDAWITKDSLAAVHGALPSTDTHLYFIPEALHSLHENPRKARAVYRQLVSHCRAQFFGLSVPTDIRQPAQRDIGLQSRLERDRARAQRQMGQQELVDFWRDYLSHFHYVVNVHDYWQLLDHIYRLLALPDGDTLVFDAGCGNGNFGVFLMVNQAYQQRHISACLPPSLKYVGGDFILHALTQAKSNFLKAPGEFGAHTADAQNSAQAMKPALTLLNLNRRLPFHDEQFARIVCNLVIAYVDDPLFTLRELMRVLAPGGKLVLTNLKPRPDLSQIFRNFVQTAERAEEVEEARQLLQNSGKIIRAESDGVFRFFDRQELTHLLTASGARPPPHLLHLCQPGLHRRDREERSGVCCACWPQPKFLRAPGPCLTYYALSGLVNGIAATVLGVFVYRRAPCDRRHLTYGLFCLAVSVWSYAYFAWHLTASRDLALIFTRLLMAGAIVIPIAYLHHILTLLDRVDRQRRLLISGYALSGALLLADATPHMVADVAPALSFPHWPQPGLLFPIFLAWFMGLAIYAIYLISSEYRAAKGLRRNQFLYLAIASLIGYTGGATNFPLWYGLPIPPDGTILVTVYTALVAYAMVRYRLLDFTVVMQKGLAYLLLTCFVAAPAFMILLEIQRAYFGETNYQFSAIMLALFVLAISAAYRLRTRTQALIDRTLFRHRQHMYKTLSEFPNALVTNLDLKTLTDTIVRTLADVIGIASASLYLLDKEHDAYLLSASRGLDSRDGPPVRVRAQDRLPTYLAQAQTILVREELEQAPPRDSPRFLADTLMRLGSDLCIPFANKGRLIGFCNLGPRTDRRMYAEEDLRLLATLGQNAAIALDNAMLYEDLRRSQTLMRRTDRLRSLEIIAGGFAHEIRNPLTSIKTFIQLAPERKDDEEFMGTFSAVVAEDVHRIERLIQEILDYARYMEPKFTEEDLNDIVASCLYFIEVKADGKGITIEKNLATDLPPVLVDRQQIKQVLLNLFLNAMDAMDPVGGQLSVRTHRLTKPAGDAWVQIEVADTGSGIPADSVEHIFDPFYTTKHESGERTGTGLGLTIVHEIVQEHHGTIDVDSTLGAGTTFVVTLPVDPLHGRATQGYRAHEATDSPDR